MAPPKTSPKPPKRLYKFRGFNVLTLRMITESELYYAPPKDFNDPLDCDPCFEIDMARPDLEHLHHALLLESGVSEEKAREEVGYNRFLSRQYGDYRSDKKINHYLARLSADSIAGIVRKELDGHGVLSLSERWTSPLMWSHYADQHRGLCFEFETSEAEHPRLQKIRYGQPRGIKLSDVALWKRKKDEDAKQRVMDVFYLSKAQQWSYEKEWRDTSEKAGVKDATFAITAILFGSRCNSAVVTSIVKLLSHDRDVKLYRVHQSRTGFRLYRRLIDRDEVEAVGVREPIHRMFAKFDDYDDLDDLDDIILPPDA